MSEREKARERCAECGHMRKWHYFHEALRIHACRWCRIGGVPPHKFKEADRAK